MKPYFVMSIVLDTELFGMKEGKTLKDFTIKEQLSQFDGLHTTGIAYELIREVLIPDLLGKELPSILYWAGKNIARKYPVTSEEDIIRFFKEAGWGDLIMKAKKSNGVEFELTGDFIKARNQSRKETSYNMEAGFIAQQYEMLNNVITEAFVEQKKRHNIVHFTVKSDRRDFI